MSIFTFHLAKTSALTALKALINPPKARITKGLIHVECMSSMVLGAPIFSTKRMLLRQFVLFAQWENEAAIDHFLENNALGKTLAKGWHVRLKFLRQWGFIDKFKIPKEGEAIANPDETVVAVTIARMRPLQIPRFISWGQTCRKIGP